MKSSQRLSIVTLFALFFITIVLRPPVAVIGPLLHEITASIGLDAGLAGLLTSAPVFCFGLGAFASPALVRRFGVNHAMLLVLAILFASIAARVWFGYWALLAGTIAAGLSIAVANVLLPTVVRIDFPKRVALVTGAYTTLLAISASFSASIAVPSSSLLGGWQPALFIWAAPALLAVLLWWPRTSAGEPHVIAPTHAVKAESRAVYRSPIAWAILGFFGLQSLGFYSLLGWLPSMLIENGIEPATAGGLLGLATAIGIPSGLALAPLIAKLRSLAWLISAASTLTLTGFTLLAVVIATKATEGPTLILACIFVGLGQAATFPMSLSLIGTRASTQAQTTVLSAMSQGWGYLLAALGTYLVGLLAEVSGTWLSSVIVLAALTVVQIAVGAYSGRPGHIKPE